MKTITIPRNTKTVLQTAAFLLALLSTTALPMLLNPSSAQATGTDTYPTSIAGCRAVSGTPAGTFTCNLKGSTQDMYFDPWSEENRECTSYVAWMLSSVNGFTMPFYDNAVGWKQKALDAHYTVDMTPKVGSIFWKSTPANVGHVAYVEWVSADGTHVTTEDYNAAFTGVWAEQSNILANTAEGYIHFKDTGGGGAPTNSVLSTVSMPNGQQLVFWKGGDGNLWDAYWSGSAWYKQGIGQANGFGQLYSPPAAVYQPSTGWVQVFWEGPGHTLYQAVLNNGTWVGGWNLNVGSTVYSQPTAAVNGNQVNVFWKDSSGGLEEAVWNGSAWVPYNLSSNFWNMATAPSASEHSSGEIDVFWTDTAGNLCEAVWNGSAWVGFTLPVGLISSQPVTDLEPTTNFQDVFWKDSSNLKEAVWNGSAWVTFTIPGATTLATAPASTAWGSQIDVYWTDSSGNLQEAVWNGSAWVEFTIPGMGPIPSQ